LVIFRQVANASEVQFDPEHSGAERDVSLSIPKGPFPKDTPLAQQVAQGKWQRAGTKPVAAVPADVIEQVSDVPAELQSQIGAGLPYSQDLDPTAFVAREAVSQTSRQTVQITQTARAADGKETLVYSWEVSGFELLPGNDEHLTFLIPSGVTVTDLRGFLTKGRTP